MNVAVKGASAIKILLWPFRMLWSLIGGIFRLTGRLLCGVLGLVVLIIGLVLTITIVGAGVGIPMLIIGFLMLIRAFF